MFPYEKAAALCRLYPHDLFYTVIDNHPMLLSGAAMSGYILPNDEIQEFKKFS